MFTFVFVVSVCFAFYLFFPRKNKTTREIYMTNYQCQAGREKRKAGDVGELIKLKVGSKSGGTIHRVMSGSSGDDWSL